MVVIVCAVVLVYWNGLDAPFIWDDRTAIVDNPTIRSLWPPWKPLIPPLDTPVSRRPLVNLSFALNYSLSSLEVRGYHVVNLALHLLTACLLLSFTRRALSSESVPERIRSSASTIALLATLWWAVHPLASEIVNYTTQRTTALAAFFFAATLYAAQRALEVGQRRRWHVGALLACTCGVMAKEFVAVAPLVILFYDRGFAFGSFRQAFVNRKHLYASLTASWVLLGTILALRPHSSVGFAAGIGVWTYALNQAEMIVRYLRLAVWPDALVLDYGVPRTVSLQDVWPSLLTVALLLGASIVALIRWRRVGFVCSAFFLLLAPASSLIPVATEVGAERRMYLPLAAVATVGAVAATWLLGHLQRRVPDRHRHWVATAGVVVAITWVTALAIRTVYRNDEFATRVAVWRSSVERWPQGRARSSYAAALIDAGQRESAVRQLRLAVHDFPKARFALANELAVDARYEEAVSELSAFIATERRPADRLPARMLRARIRAELGRVEEAIAEYRALVDRFPSLPAPRERLAALLLSRGDVADAITHYRVLLDRQPNHSGWLVNLGRALAASGQAADAASAYRRALEVDARDAAAHVGLASLLLRAGNVHEGALHAEAAVALDPGNAVSRNLLGVARAMEGRLEDAVAHFRESIALDPQYAEARANLTRAQYELGTRPERRTGVPES